MVIGFMDGNGNGFFAMDSAANMPSYVSLIRTRGRALRRLIQRGSGELLSSCCELVAPAAFDLYCNNPTATKTAPPGLGRRRRLASWRTP